MQIVCTKDTKRGIIVKQLQHIMVDYNIKNGQLVDRLGMTKGTVSNLMSQSYRADGSITVDQLAHICDAMDCDMVITITRRTEPD